LPVSEQPAHPGAGGSAPPAAPPRGALLPIRPTQGGAQPPGAEPAARGCPFWSAASHRRFSFTAGLPSPCTRASTSSADAPGGRPHPPRYGNAGRNRPHSHQPTKRAASGSTNSSSTRAKQPSTREAGSFAGDLPLTTATEMTPPAIRKAPAPT